MKTSFAAVHAAHFATAIVWGPNVSVVKAPTEQAGVLPAASLRTVLLCHQSRTGGPPWT